MKTGDILTCKRSFKDYKVGQSYRVESVRFVKSWYNPGKYKTHKNYSYRIIYIEGLSGENQIKYRWGLFTDGYKINNIQGEYIWNYFYTKQEWRKIKLEKLIKN